MSSSCPRATRRRLWGRARLSLMLASLARPRGSHRSPTSSAETSSSCPCRSPSTRALWRCCRETRRPQPPASHSNGWSFTAALRSTLKLSRKPSSLRPGRTTVPTLRATRMPAPDSRQPTKARGSASPRYSPWPYSPSRSVVAPIPPPSVLVKCSPPLASSLLVRGRLSSPQLPWLLFPQHWEESLRASSDFGSRRFRWMQELPSPTGAPSSPALSVSVSLQPPFNASPPLSSYEQLHGPGALD